MQQHSPPLLPSLLHALNETGTGWPSVALVVAAAAWLVALGRPRLALLFAAVNLLRPIDTLLKLLTDRPRPSAALVHVSEHASGTSFPSGHVFSAMLLYGTLAVLVAYTPLPTPARRLLQSACLAVVVLMGVARVYVGAHWPSDVLGSWLWGGLIIAIVVRETVQTVNLRGGRCGYAATS
jgi:undecaprenyl-diphosphatase